MGYLLIIGATSEIAIETAKLYAKNGFDLYLTARNISKLRGLQNTIQAEYKIQVRLRSLDLNLFDSHKKFFNSLNPKPVGVILAAGYMDDQMRCEIDFKKTLQTLNTNYVGAVSILNIISNHYEESKSGFIVGISSVAGDRGRKNNYIYGSSKAGLSCYLSGIRNRLQKSNIAVLTVKPGFVYTKMTAHLSLPKKLSSNAKSVAKDIFNAQQSGRNIIYTKSMWYLIMFIIKHIPESIFKKLNL